MIAIVIYDLWSTQCQEQRPKISVLNNHMWNPEMKQCALQDVLNLISYRAWNYLLRAWIQWLGSSYIHHKLRKGTVGLPKAKFGKKLFII